MDISTLNGFLTGILIGPETITPNPWLSIVWGETEKDEMAWESVEKKERVMGLNMRTYNSITQAFLVDPPDFRPLLQILKVNGEETTIIDEWCFDFMRSIGLTRESWQPLVDVEARKAPIFPIYLHGTEKGYLFPKIDPKISAVPHDEWVAMLPAAVQEIYEFWLPFRHADAPPKRTTVIPKDGPKCILPVWYREEMQEMLWCC